MLLSNKITKEEAMFLSKPELDGQHKRVVRSLVAHNRAVAIERVLREIDALATHDRVVLRIEMLADDRARRNLVKELDELDVQ